MEPNQSLILFPPVSGPYEFTRWDLGITMALIAVVAFIVIWIIAAP